MKEEWRAVVGFEGKYEVSSLGCVRSLDREKIGKNGSLYRISGRVLRTKHKCSYANCTLRAGKKGRVTKNVATLVLEAFSGKRPAGFVCRHMDGNSHNDRADNLEWGTYKQNSLDMHRHGTMKSAKLSPDDVFKINDMLCDGTRVCDIAKLFNVGVATIYRVGVNTTWKWIM